MFEPLHPRRFRRDHPVAALTGALFGLLALATAWAGAVANAYAALGTLLPDWPIAPMVLGTFVADVVGLGVPALVYVTVRRLDVPIRGSLRENLGTVALVTATPIAFVVGTSVVASLVLDSSVAELHRLAISPAVDPLLLARFTVVPSLFSALGTGALVYGAVQTRLQGAVSREDAAVLTTLVAGLFFLLPLGSLSNALFDPVRTVVFLLASGFGVFTSVCLGLVYRGVERGELSNLTRVAYAPLFLLGALGLLAALSELSALPQIVTSLGQVVVLAAAAYGYARTASISTPILVLFTYEVAIDLVVYAEVLVGVAPTP